MTCTCSDDVHQKSARLPTCIPEESGRFAELKRLACTSARAQFASFKTEAALAVLQDAIVRLA